MNELIVYTVLLVVWFALQLWILPALGIPTCMSGSCAVPPAKKSRPNPAQTTEESDQEVSHVP